MKTNRAAAKRFRFTASGKIRRARAFVNHILTKKSSKRKRQLRHSQLIHPSDTDNAKALLPYS